MIRSCMKISYTELQPHSAKVKGTGFLEGSSEPLVLGLDFLYRAWEKVGTSENSIQSICFCILSSDYLYEIFKKKARKGISGFICQMDALTSTVMLSLTFSLLPVTPLLFLWTNEHKIIFCSMAEFQ